MKNWRKIVVTGMVAGMIAFTGCSSNVPETNQGNRNGQRVVDAVNNRAGNYNAGRTRNTTRRADGTRVTRGFNRGVNRGAHHGRHGVNHNVGTSTHATRTPHRSTTNRVANPQRGRVGHTFGYDHSGYADSLYHDGGYDLAHYGGINTATPGAQRNNSTSINNRVVRSTPATPNHTARKSTRKAPTGTLTRSATPSRNTVTPAPKATKTTTRSTTPARSTAAPKANANRTTTRNHTPKATANRSVTRSTTNRAAAPKVANNTHVVRGNQHRPTTQYRNSRPVGRTHRARNTGTGLNIANSYKPAPQHNQDIIKHSAIIEHQEQVVNNRLYNTGVHHMRNMNQTQRSTPTRGITRNSSVRNDAKANGTANRGSRRHPASNVTNNINATNGITTRKNLAHRSNADVINQGLYGSSNFTVDGNNQFAIPANASENNDYAFFKRNKTQNDETPATPVPGTPGQSPAGQAPTPAAQPVPNRNTRTAPTAQPVPNPAVTPAPTSMGDHAYDADDMRDNIHDIDDGVNNDKNLNNDDNGNYGNQLKPVPRANRKTTPARRLGQRVMK
ncbi:MAG: hypothetical protein FWE11_03520 [Defluviitaleaceae bacterium]|nr:hypothetical protein [Defluviitaleaceae bacterium]